MDRHAGKGGDLHQTGVNALQAGGGLHQRVMSGAELFDLGQQGAAVGGQHHAAPVAAEELYPQLVLQRLHRVADAGLGEVQGLGRFGEVAALGRFQENLVFGDAHAAASLLWDSNTIISYFFS